MDKIKIKYDIFFIGVVLLFALLVWGIFQLGHQSRGDMVVVFRDGEELFRYPLSENRDEIISFAEGYNLLMISNGEAFVSDADCPDGLCIRQRAISRNGESIICLPHKLVIRIEAEKESELDAVTY